MPLKSNIGILHLPAELKSNIAGFCSSSTLAALTLCNSSFKKEAERQLYRSVALVSVGPRHILGSDKKCIQTLLKYPSKASLVRSLYIECTRNGKSGTKKWNAMENIFQVLVHLPFLSELNARIYSEHEGERLDALGKLEDILCGNKLSGLKVLYCDGYLDYSKVILARRNLEMLGIYNISADGRTTSIIDTLQEVKRLVPPVIMLPTVFILSEVYLSDETSSQALSIYPSFYEQTATIPSYSSVIDSINHALLSGQPCIDICDIDTIQIFMHDATDGLKLRAHVDAISELVNQHNIHTFEIYFEKQNSAPLFPKEVARILSLFPGLREFRLKVHRGQ